MSGGDYILEVRIKEVLFRLLVKEVFICAIIYIVGVAVRNLLPSKYSLGKLTRYLVTC